MMTVFRSNIDKIEHKPEWQSSNVQDSQKSSKNKSNIHWLDLGMNVLFNHKVGTFLLLMTNSAIF